MEADAAPLRRTVVVGMLLKLLEDLLSAQDASKACLRLVRGTTFVGIRFCCYWLPRNCKPLASCSETML